jgi:hypothetical protein
VTVSHSPAGIGTKALHIQIIPDFQGDRKITQEVGDFFLHGLIVKNDFIVLAEMVGIGPWFQNDYQVFVEPFNLHKILGSQILKQIRIFFGITCTAKIFVHIERFQIHDLGQIHPTPEADPELVKEAGSLGLYALDQQQSCDN